MDLSQLDINLVTVAGVAALAGLTLGLIIGMVRSQGARDALRRELQAEQKILADQFADARSGIAGLESELRQYQSRLQESQRALQGERAERKVISEHLHSLQAESAELQAIGREREDKYREQLELLNENKESLKREFENLAHRIFEDKGKSFTTTSKQSLEALLQPFRDQIAGFHSRVNEVHDKSVKGNAALEKEIAKVLEIGLAMNSQATNLAQALKGDKKTTGNWGEAQLQRTLELAGLLPGDHYETQAAFRDEDGKRRLPDFLIKLPDNKCLVIDSKVSLVDYDRAIAAETEEQREEALTAHAQAVRNHIDDLSGKDYAGLAGLDSPDFVLMFMPVEPAYIEAMKHNRDLFNYGYQKQVVMVSHTTLMPILRTVANLWMIDRSNREAREISNRAGEIYNQVCAVAERMGKLGKTLQSANNHYNDTLTSLVGKQGLYGKIDRFRTLSGKVKKEMVEPEPLHTDIELERLEAIELTPVEESPAEALPEDEKPTLQ